MSHATTEVTKEKLFEDFNAVVAETEQLLNSLAGAGADKAGAMRASVEQGLAAAGERLAQIRAASIAQAQASAHATDEYVHTHPWQSIGVTAAVAALAGLAAGLMIARR
jgi:ElaB/YqjD/DUF883 family membrane-anchored ribosome-binding protein